MGALVILKVSDRTFCPRTRSADRCSGHRSAESAFWLAHRHGSVISSRSVRMRHSCATLLRAVLARSGSGATLAWCRPGRDTA
jgi:hypothetical protein